MFFITRGIFAIAIAHVASLKFFNTIILFTFNGPFFHITIERSIWDRNQSPRGKRKIILGRREYLFVLSVNNQQHFIFKRISKEKRKEKEKSEGERNEKEEEI